MSDPAERMSESQRTWFGGPRVRDVEVPMLIEEFGAPWRGVTIAYPAIEMTIGLHYGTSRFRRVVDAWRDYVVEQYGIASVADPAKGIRFLYESERKDVDAEGMRTGMRKTFRFASDLRRVDRAQLTEPQQKDLDHKVVTAARLSAVAVPAYRDLRPPPALRALPRA